LSTTFQNVTFSTHFNTRLFGRIACQFWLHGCGGKHRPHKIFMPSFLVTSCFFIAIAPVILVVAIQPSQRSPPVDSDQGPQRVVPEASSLPVLRRPR
jgi:hypothetical protein